MNNRSVASHRFCLYFILSNDLYMHVYIIRVYLYMYKCYELLLNILYSLIEHLEGAIQIRIFVQFRSFCFSFFSTEKNVISKETAIHECF